MGATVRPQNTGGPGAKQSHPRTSYSGVLKSGATKTEEKTTTKIKKKKKSKDTKKKSKDKKKKDKDEDKEPVIELPFRPREPWKSPVIEVTEITDDMSDVPMPDIGPGESSDDDDYGIGPDAREEVDASLYFKLIEEDEKIHPDDFEKRIAHCEEALEQANQKIAPVIQDRLNLLEAQRDQRDELLDKWPDHTYSVALRLDFFERLKAFLLADGDPNQVISCINAIVKAYRSKKLQWIPGYVTYWSYGKQLTQLRAFDWEEFLIWNFKYKGVKGFWVEGLRDTPVNQFLQHRTCYPAKYDTFHDVDVKVPIGLKFCLPPHSHRLPDPNTNVVPGRFTRAETDRWNSVVPRGAPGAPLVNGNPPRGGEKRPSWAGGPANLMWYGPEDKDPSTNTTVLFWMTDDTGADVCSIQERDLEQMYHVKNNHEDPTVVQAQPPLLAYYEMRGASAGDPHKFVPCRAMRIHCYANKDVDGRLNTMLKQAELIEVLITKNSLNPFDPPVRLLGPWLRHRFYTATSPDRSGRLYIYKRHLQLITIRPSDPPLSGAYPMVNNLRIGPEHPAAEQDIIVPP